MFDQKCSFCKTHLATKSCDFVTSAKGTRRAQQVICNAPMCHKCATEVGKNKDYCPEHSQMEAA